MRYVHGPAASRELLEQCRLWLCQSGRDSARAGGRGGDVGCHPQQGMLHLVPSALLQVPLNKRWEELAFKVGWIPGFTTIWGITANHFEFLQNLLLQNLFSVTSAVLWGKSNLRKLWWVKQLLAILKYFVVLERNKKKPEMNGWMMIY